jgi:hypothetical protein
MGKAIEKMNVGELRAEYARIRDRSEAKSKDVFNAAVQELLATKVKGEPTPLQFVKAAGLVSFPCGRCAGTGSFITGTLNGKPTGPGGPCFRCSGKGRQNDADVRRNWYYDTHCVRVAA